MSDEEPDPIDPILEELLAEEERIDKERERRTHWRRRRRRRAAMAATAERAAEDAFIELPPELYTQMEAVSLEAIEANLPSYVLSNIMDEIKLVQALANDVNGCTAQIEIDVVIATVVPGPSWTGYYELLSWNRNPDPPALLEIVTAPPWTVQVPCGKGQVDFVVARPPPRRVVTGKFTNIVCATTTFSCPCVTNKTASSVMIDRLTTTTSGDGLIAGDSPVLPKENYPRTSSAAVQSVRRRDGEEARPSPGGPSLNPRIRECLQIGPRGGAPSQVLYTPIHGRRRLALGPLQAAHGSLDFQRPSDEACP
jgi:hypothetical protein